MLDILAYLPAKRKTSTSGWTSFNAPCCVHNGENQDRRSRGGLKIADLGWSFHCFNCGYTASFTLGRNLSYKARKLLTWLNVPPEEIERVNLESLKHKSIAGLLNERQQTENRLQDIRFEERKLPNDLTPAWQSDHSADYLKSRGLQDDYPLFYKTGTRSGIVIPFTHDNQIVGSSIRFLDNKIPKYINDIQPGYVFGTDLQHDAWNYVLVMEGVFDALSISGLAVLHAEINDAQVRLIRSLGKEVVVVPDQESAGMKLVDRAVELGWSVSMPEWPDCKDVNDAVIKYGRLATLITILQAREHSRIKIELRKKQIVKRIRN
jgi:energy-converting hydrogenase A subunit M